MCGEQANIFGQLTTAEEKMYLPWLTGESHFQGLNWGKASRHFFLFRTPWPLWIWTTSPLLCQYNTTTLQFTWAKCMVTKFLIGKLRYRWRFSIYAVHSNLQWESGISRKDDQRREWVVLKQTGHEFQPGKWDYLFGCSVSPENFPLDRPKKAFLFALGKLRNVRIFFGTK